MAGLQIDGISVVARSHYLVLWSRLGAYDPLWLDELLAEGALVGRLDPKAHRKEDRFEIKALHLEPGVPVTEELVAELAGALRGCAAWHGTPEIVVRQSDPPELSALLKGLLEEIRPESLSHCISLYR
jgi:uncharacterized protein YcaQ